MNIRSYGAALTEVEAEESELLVIVKLQSMLVELKVAASLDEVAASLDEVAASLDEVAASLDEFVETSLAYGL